MFTVNYLLTFRFCVQVKQESFPSFTLSPLTPSPGHTLIIHPPVIIGNLLPFDFHFCYTNREKLLPHGKMVPIHTVRIYTCDLVYIYTYIHTYIHTYTHTHIHTYIHTYIVHTYIHIYIRVHTYTHTHIVVSSSTQLNPLHSVKFSVTKLEGFSSSEECTVSVEDVGVVRNLVVMDTRGRKLYLSVSTELIGRVSLKVNNQISFCLPPRLTYCLLLS